MKIAELASLLGRVRRALRSPHLVRRVLRLAMNCTTRRPVVVFDIAATGLREHYEPVVTWLIDHSRCHCILVVPDQELGAYFPSRVDAALRDRVSILRFNEFARWPFRPAVTVSMHPENGSLLARRFVGTGTWRVVMQHGLSDKAAFGEIERADPLSDFDVVFLTGPAFQAGSLVEYRKKYPATCSRLEFLEIGSPRTDSILGAKFDRAATLRDLGLPPERKTICYAPTWEPTASLEQGGVAIIEALASLPVNVIVKLHHVSRYEAPLGLHGNGCRNWPGIVSDIQTRFANVRLASGHAADPYLHASDLLVSDASGVAYEYLLLDRPIIFFDVPALFDQYGTNGIHWWGRSCGVTVKTTGDLVCTVKDQLSQPDSMSAERQKLTRSLVYNPGCATRAAGMALLGLSGRSNVR